MWCDRRFIRRLFNVQIPKGKAGKALTKEYQCFLTGFLIGCGFEAKRFQDFVDFRKEFKLKTADLQTFFRKHKEEGMWAVVENKDDKTQLAYFKDGIRKSEWEPLA